MDGHDDTHDDTARLALPFIQPGQAQKELWHNEALLRLDLLVQASVEAVGRDDPPTAPVVGQAWVVGDAPTGAWAGRACAIAGWTTGGWRFAAAVPGMAAWSIADGRTARFVGGAWTIGLVAATRVTVDGVPVLGSRAAAIGDPVGGGVVDAEARTAVTAILAALRGHGLIAR